jgi:hypothetical protein
MRLTLGGLGIWWLIDFILVCADSESCRRFVITRRDGQGSPDYGNRAWAPGRAEAKGSRGDA